MHSFHSRTLMRLYLRSTQRFSVLAYRNKSRWLVKSLDSFRCSSGASNNTGPVSPPVTKATDTTTTTTATTTATLNGDASQQQGNIKETKLFRRGAGNWNTVFSGLAALGTFTGIVFYVNEKLKYSDKRKYKVIKAAMLKEITIAPFKYPELCIPEQAAVMRDIVFSDSAKLVLIEGAQGSGKTTLVQKLLNERIKDSKVPCYYWSLKKDTSRTDFAVMFSELFGIGTAMKEGSLAKESVDEHTISSVLWKLKDETGVPAVLVVDDAQRLLLSQQGEGVSLFLQECYREELLTTIFIGSEGSVLPQFKAWSGYDSRLRYVSLPPIPDQAIKDYLLGPLNDHLKAAKGCRLFDEKLAEWYVGKFGANFLDMKEFIDEVLKGGADPEKYLSEQINQYHALFRVAQDYPDCKAILDTLLKNGEFDMLHSFDLKTLDYLIQSNIVGRRKHGYTWNKRLRRTAYEKFAEEQQRLAEEQQRLAEEQQRLAEQQQKLAEEKQRLAEQQQRLAEEKQRPWYRRLW